LKDQNVRTKDSDDEMLKNLHYVKELGYQSMDALEKGDTATFGEIMHTHWLHKKQRSSGMSNPQIDTWYDLAMNNGAVGGKLVGAGGGGFLMFMASDRNKLRHAMSSAGLEEVRFRFDFEGSKVVLSS
jgi:D-glycero-alpha-D-manno-heptose-7-phosphate kinase